MSNFSECKVISIQSTKYKVQSTKYKVQSTECLILRGVEFLHAGEWKGQDFGLAYTDHIQA